MRMTNKIMQNNSLYNINNNKVLQDKLSTQMSTQKKLTRPSDDPVVAIRALRLRSSVSELTQYQEKNAPDAESWLKVTSGGLSTVTDILTSLSTNANKGSNKDLTADDLDIIVENMQLLADEFYSTGNLDYAGRYVFTGYRTDTPMQFTAADVANEKTPIPSYSITEQTTISSFDLVNYTNIGTLDGLSEYNYADGTHDEIETNVANSDIHRIRLAYDNLSKETANVPSIQIVNKIDYDPATLVYTPDYALELNDSSTPAIEIAASADDAYKDIAAANEAGTSKILYIPDTGEILFSDEAYKTLDAAVQGANGKDTEIRLTYTKSDWNNGDLRPEHYFACTSTDKLDATRQIAYNAEYLTSGKEKQVIAYDVGYNQTIEVNTTADEVFTHNLKRDMDDLVNALSSLKNIEQIKGDLTSILKGIDKDADPARYETVKNQLDAASKSYEYIRQNMHELMGNTITKMQNYLDVTNVAVTDNGTRSSRLELITNRLTEQKTTFKTLQSENEDVDIAEVAVNLTSAELTYESSLMATSKIMQTTLMNYI